MTAKEKAIEIFNFFENYPLTIEYKRQCSIFNVNEILQSLDLNLYFNKNEINSLEYTSDDNYIHETQIIFWEDVKKELETYDPYQL